MRAIFWDAGKLRTQLGAASGGGVHRRLYHEMQWGTLGMQPVSAKRPVARLPYSIWAPSILLVDPMEKNSIQALSTGHDLTTIPIMRGRLSLLRSRQGGGFRLWPCAFRGFVSSDLGVYDGNYLRSTSWLGFANALPSDAKDSVGTPSAREESPQRAASMRSSVYRGSSGTSCSWR